MLDVLPLSTASAEKSQVPALRPERVFAQFKNAAGLVLGVSGGPDSTALMLLAARWVRESASAQGRCPPIFVVTVDHQLRPDSRVEAETVAAWARALGLPHKILAWEGAKPKTRIMELARAARYDLLCSFAGEMGADHIVTAHHADDQAETILFRLLRGSGLKGLGGMQAVTRRGHVKHVRPLLAWPKDSLIALCHDAGHPYFEDPSNRNPAFARTRMRALTGLLAEHGLTRDAVLRLGRRAAQAETALHARACHLVEALPETRSDEVIKVDVSTVRGEPVEIFGRILRFKIQAFQPGEGFQRLDRLETLAARMHRALSAKEACSASFSGTVLHLDARGVLSLRPEPTRRRGRSVAAREAGVKDRLTTL